MASWSTVEVSELGVSSDRLTLDDEQKGIEKDLIDIPVSYFVRLHSWSRVSVFKTIELRTHSEDGRSRNTLAAWPCRRLLACCKCSPSEKSKATNLERSFPTLEIWDEFLIEDVTRCQTTNDTKLPPFSHCINALKDGWTTRLVIYERLFLSLGCSTHSPPECGLSYQLNLCLGS